MATRPSRMSGTSSRVEYGIAAAIGVAAGYAVLRGAGGTQPGGTPTPTPGGGGSQHAPVWGIFDRDGMPQTPSLFDGFVMLVPWSTLQPDPSGPLVTTDIHRGLQQAAAHGLQTMLRIDIRDKFPPWLLTKCGHIPYTVPQGGINTTVPIEWGVGQAPFLDAYRSLHTALAAEFDGQIGMVAAHAGAVYYDEPCQAVTPLGAPHDVNGAALVASGFSTASHLDTMRGGWHIHSDVWKRTPTSFSVNPVNVFDPTTFTAAPDDAITRQLIMDFAAALPRGVIENNSMGNSGSSGSHMAAMYQAMKDCGLNQAIQTDRMSAVVGPYVPDLVERVVQQGACMLEWTSGEPIDQAIHDLYSARLHANLR